MARGGRWEGTGLMTGQFGGEGYPEREDRLLGGWDPALGAWGRSRFQM